MNTFDLPAYTLALHICSKVLQEAPNKYFLGEVRAQRLFAAWPLSPSTDEAAGALAVLNQEYSLLKLILKI